MSDELGSDSYDPHYSEQANSSRLSHPLLQGESSPAEILLKGLSILIRCGAPINAMHFALA